MKSPSLLKFENPLENGEHLYIAFLTGAATIFAPLDKKEDKYVVEIPEDLKSAGTVFVVIFEGGDDINEVRLDDETTVAGPAIAVFPFDSRGKYPESDTHLEGDNSATCRIFCKTKNSAPCRILWFYQGFCLWQNSPLPAVIRRNMTRSEIKLFVPFFFWFEL